MNKIKGKIGIDTDTIMCLLVIILVGVGSFGLGRLSVANSKEESVIKLENINDTNVKEEIGNNREVINDNFTSREKMYVASKNGKLYYKADCSGAKRISPKNEVWFASALEAEKAGYNPSPSCK